MSDFDCDPLFSRIYLEMLEQMTAYSARRLGDIGLAEDVAQDTFAECWKNWEQGQQDVKYIRGGVEHSLAQNRAIYTASWTNGLNIVSIIGDVTEEELEQMIDSIYT